MIHYDVKKLGVYFLSDDLVSWFKDSIGKDFTENEVLPFTDAIEELADKIKEEDA
jgi:hypothetical protein